MTSPEYQSSKAKGMAFLYSKKKKKYDAAIIEFEKALSIPHDDNGKTAELHNLIGFTLFRKKDYRAALDAFEIAVDKATRNLHENNHPTAAVSDLGWMYYRMGKCFHELRDYQAASDYLERSTSIFQQVQANSSHLESLQNTNTTMARKLRLTLALSKSKRAKRRSRRDNSVIIKENIHIKPTERLFDTEPQVDESVIWCSKTSRKEERDGIDSKSVTSCTTLGTGSLSSGDHVERVCA
jgi:tetratricopeptide (TPR) repeat protein